MNVQQSNNSLRVVAVELRRDAAMVRALAGDDAAAAFAYDRAADKLEAALVAQGSRLLGVRDAANLFGRHRDTIGNAIRDGRLVNYGEKNRPRLRFDELERAFGQRAVANRPPVPYDASADAQSRANARRGEVQ